MEKSCWNFRCGPAAGADEPVRAHNFEPTTAVPLSTDDRRRALGGGGVRIGGESIRQGAVAAAAAAAESSAVSVAPTPGQRQWPRSRSLSVSASVRVCRARRRRRLFSFTPFELFSVGPVPRGTRKFLAYFTSLLPRRTHTHTHTPLARLRTQ